MTIQAQEQIADEAPQRVFQDLLVAPHPELGQPQGATLSEAGTPDPKQVALAFVSGGQAGLLATAPELSWDIKASESLDPGVQVVRLTQTKGGVPIFGAGLTMQVEGDSVRSISGAFVPAVAADTKPALSVDEALKAARVALASAAGDEASSPQAELKKSQLSDSELVLFNPALFDLGQAPTALAYRLVLTTPDNSLSTTVIVDALSGKPLLQYDNHDIARNRSVRDANGATNVNAAACYREAGPVGTPSSECTAAFQNMGLTYDYFLNTHGRDSFNNAGAEMITVVRYGTIANAYWDGQLTVFGPSFATRDVVAHEWTHAVTQYTAGLIYQNQSGALNEAFSDIFGAMVDRDDWLVGEDTSAGTFRDMANPPAHGQPDRVSNYNCTTSDNGGVHTNSGIPNKLAYLMSDGGTFNGRTVSAIGRAATERIFYRALVGGLSSRATFSDLNNALLSAAAALYGQSSAQYTATQTAAQAVELGQAIPCDTAQPDPFESDNSPAEARQIATDGTLHQPHNFHVADDQDWMRFTASAGATYVIETTGLQARADTVMELFAADGTTRLASNDDIGSGNLASRISWRATSSDTLLIRVVNFGGTGGANTGYQVRVTSDAPQGGEDAYEPDNSRATARSITVGGAAQDHNFHQAGDEDWVSFSAVISTPYVIETFDLGTTSDTVLELYNSAGTLLASNDDIPGSWASRIGWTAPASGVYTVKVRHYWGSGGATTSYRLRVTGTAPVGDSFEPDNSAGAAQAIVVNGATQTHTFHTPGDEDWVAFDATPANAYVIETLNLTSGSDTVLELYSSAGSLLASNDDFSGLASRVGYMPDSAQRLFVKVRHFSSRTGSPGIGYDVRVSATPIHEPDPQEPDNTPGQAHQVVAGPLDQPTILSYNFHIPNDQDWAQLSTIAGNTYVFETTDLETRADTVLTLFAANGTTSLNEDDDSGPGFGSRIVWVAPSSDTYFLRVRHFSTGVSGAGTGYRLRISSSGTTADPDIYEDDNTAAAARPIGINEVGQVHNFHAAGDHDWVTFTGSRGVEYTLTTSQLGTRADTVLELFDSSGTNQLAYNDDYLGWASQIVWTAPSDGTYKARVRQFSPTSFGANTAYTLRLFSASDSYEPDNSQSAARTIEVNSATAQAHNFHVAGDQDWVTFSATSGLIYTIYTANLGTCGDTVLELYSSDGVVRAANDDNNGLASQIVWRTTESGPLFVKVRHYSSLTAGACTTYDLRVSGVVDSTDPYEPDNTRAEARSITVNGAAQAHNFHLAGDQDWVTFSAAAGWTYTVATSDLGPCGDTVVELYDSGNNLLGLNDDYGGLASRVVWIASAAQPVFVHVRHFSSGVSGACTAYNLAVTGLAVGPDAFEPDNSLAEASYFSVNGTAQTHTFHTPSDEDWVRFTGVAGTIYTINTFDLGLNSDTVMTLFDATGTQQLAYNDDYSGWASRIVWTAPGNATYALRVKAFGSSGGRESTNYSLRIVTGASLAEAASPVPSAQVAFDADGALAPATGGQLRLTGAEVSGVAQVGAEFTTIVRATGSASDFKLSAQTKPTQLELVAIQPLEPSGAAFDLALHPSGPPWSAQGSSASDLAVYQPWSSQGESTLVALRWRVVTQPASKQIVLPISLVGRAADGTTWLGGTVTVILAVDGELKVEAVSPSELALSANAFLSLQVSGLAGELPKVYLVDVENSSEQQLSDVTFAPGASDALITKVAETIKPGVYKVRVVVTSGASATSTETVRILAPGESPTTPTPEPSPKPDVTPGPVYLPMVVRN
ncbi:MAG: bacillolysin [Chloroflexales bacterium]|nr:bacillolysin [Chloroflexales bacterium]